MSKIFVGHLPLGITQDEVNYFFRGYGQVQGDLVKGGEYGFLECESQEAAQDLVDTFNGRQLLGSRLIVDFAKGKRGRPSDFDTYMPEGQNLRSPPRSHLFQRNYDDQSARALRPPLANAFRVILTGCPKGKSWQEFRAWGDQFGRVAFADIDVNTGYGALDFNTLNEAQRAIQTIDGKPFFGSPVTCYMDTLQYGPHPSTIRSHDMQGGGMRSRNAWDVYPS